MTLQATYADVAAPAQAARRAVYRPELDVLRFWAFFLVFLHHILSRQASAYAAYGEWADVLASLGNLCGYGLSLFFALSAFLITDLLRREKDATGDVHLRDFYIRRILRIWPLYFFGLALGWINVLHSGDAGDVVMLTMFMFMVGNWYFHSGEWSANPATPLWSISIEEQFYLVWPVTMKLLGRAGIYAACAALAVIGLTVAFYFGETRAAVDTTVWTNTFVQFVTFAAGAALAIRLDGRSPDLSTLARVTLMLLGLVLWFASVHVLHAKQIMLAESGLKLAAGIAVSAIGSACIVLSMVGARVKPNGVLVYLGKISFGLYVFHLLAIDMVRHVHGALERATGMEISVIAFALLAIFPTILMAVLSYRRLETPFLRMKEKFTFVKSRPV
jgi:peptidoglycan/LPS O-acetylase OafA/YrhL